MSRIDQTVSFPLSRIASALMLTALFPLSPAFAARTVTDDTVVVTATRTAQTADESLAAVQVIRREDIERAQANDVAELLRFFAGVDIARSGGPGQQTSLFLRGSESNHTLLLIDGVKVNNATDGAAAWQNIDPHLIERIEIVRGPRSSLYGSEAIGGVIQIFTRKPTATVSQGGGFGIGTNNTVRGDARVAGTRGIFRSSFGLSFQGTDGFQTLSSQTGDRGYNNKTFTAEVGADLGAVDVAFSLWSAQGKTEYYDFFATPIDQDYNNRISAITLSANPMANWSSTLKLSLTEDRIDQNQSSDVAETERWAADWQNTVQLGETQLLTAGAYASNENVNSVSFGTPLNEDRNVAAVFAQDQVTIGNVSAVVAARYTDDEYFDDETTWNATLGYRFNDRAGIYASAGTGYKAPTLFDLFGFAGNPDLDPEKSENYEIGLKYRVSAGNHLALTAFRNDIDDLVTYDFVNNVLKNIDRTRTRGVELDYRYAFGDWSGYVSGTLQDPEDRTTGDQLLRRAKRTAAATVNYKLGSYQLGARVLASSKRDDFGGEMDSYVVWDLNASKTVNRNLSLRGRLENAFDKDYETVRGYKTQGRAVYLNVVFSGEGV